jgi:hypothetical protein
LLDSTVVQLEKRWFRLVAKPALAGLSAALLLFLSTLAASPALHEFLHADAGSVDHHCVITLFTKGQVGFAPETSIIVALLTILVGAALLSEVLFLPTADYRFSSSRAPPFAASLQ